jgi:UDP-N-acetylmuramate: L-alanyl-gamma-D-glutamyl-meso-diaminopimelate ligase
VLGDLAALVDVVASEAQAGDRLVVMSNGGFGGIHNLLLERLRARAGRAT